MQSNQRWLHDLHHISEGRHPAPPLTENEGIFMLTSILILSPSVKECSIQTLCKPEILSLNHNLSPAEIED